MPGEEEVQGQLIRLPLELQIAILSNLPLTSLLRFSETCQHFYKLSRDDLLWQTFVQRNVPYKLPPLSPSQPTWRDTFVKLYPYWYLVRHKIWIANDEFMGAVLVAQYILSNNTIELWDLNVKRAENQNKC
jgi:hypothetical protein